MKHRQSIQELVRIDLVHREKTGTTLHAYNGREAILDAYEDALDLCCYLRQVIEELTIVPPPQTPAPDPPQFRAARERTEDEFAWFQKIAEGPGA